MQIVTNRRELPHFEITAPSPITGKIEHERTLQAMSHDDAARAFLHLKYPLGLPIRHTEVQLGIKQVDFVPPNFLGNSARLYLLRVSLQPIDCALALHLGPASGAHAWRLLSFDAPENEGMRRVCPLAFYECDQCACRLTVSLDRLRSVAYSELVTFDERRAPRRVELGSAMLCL